MNDKYKDDIKDQVLSRVDMASVVGRYVGLKRRGRDMVGLCPFHNEKTPSFHLNLAMGLYYCFGCGKGGNVFTFVQEMEGVGFREALEMLAEEVGVEVPRYSPRSGAAGGRGGGDVRNAKLELLDIHKTAAEFYCRCMEGSPRAVDYFNSRGLSEGTRREFMLGYAPDEWSKLSDYLVSKKVPLQKVVESGLAVSREGGGAYDRFRNRVIFPLYDTSGRVIAFAGRGLDADTQPKYLNSPESALYKKSGVLYGLHKARESIREFDYIIIVEGYMDYLTLYQAGIRNAAAASGTAFTEEHARLIKRFTSKAALVFDGDSAGLSAARRAALTLAPLGLQVSILALPGDEDPDSFVKGRGADAFRDLLKTARPASDFLIDGTVSESDGSSYGKGRAIDELAPYANALTDAIVRADFLEKLAKRLRLDTQLVADRIGGQKNPRASRVEPPPTESAAVDRVSAIGPLEEDFLKILAAEPRLIVWARQHFPPKNLTDPLAENVYSIMLGVYAEKGDLSGLLDACGNDPALRGVVCRLSVGPACNENVEDELAQKALLLQRKCVKARIADVRAKLAVCPDEEKGQLMERLRDYGERLKELG